MTSEAGFDLETVDRLLTTTRAVRRRLDLDRPVPLAVIDECLTIAVQAPTGNALQTWRWLVITDPGVRTQLAALYRTGATAKTGTDGGPDLKDRLPDPQQRRLSTSTDFLVEHLAQVPVLVVPCVEAVGGAAGWAPSIYPAVWSFMLALRSRGLGSVLTTAHLFRRHQAAELLGVPAGFEQACLVPVAYSVGTEFRPAARRPLAEVTFHNRWGQRWPEGPQGKATPSETVGSPGPSGH